MRSSENITSEFIDYAYRCDLEIVKIIDTTGLHQEDFIYFDFKRPVKSIDTAYDSFLEDFDELNYGIISVERINDNGKISVIFCYAKQGIFKF